MSFNNALPIAIGSSSTNASLANNLGEVYEQGSTGSPGWRLFRLVKNGNTVLSANWVVVTGYTSGVINWTVDTTTTANSVDVAGVVPLDFGTNTIAAGAYFLLQIGGYATPLSSLTPVARSTVPALLATGTGIGMVGQFTAGTDAGIVLQASIGAATNSTTVTVGAPGKAWLEGLL